MNEKEKLMGWRSLPLGGVNLQSGSAVTVHTGSWRTEKPVLTENKCVHCMLCWLYCPDASVLVEIGRMKGFDYDHCKGCGICAEICPTEAIFMVEEELETT